jgi:AraC-like DNA-binding protein
MIESQLRLNELPFATRISGDSGLGAILYHLSTSLFEQADSLSTVEGTSAMEGYLRILAACVGVNGAHARGNRTLELSTRIMNYIESHLTESTLGPVEIASALRVSVRHIHRAFANQGSTVGDWIWAQRLKHCRSDLCDPRLQTKSITEIAFYWGFNDSAHFSHAFKKQFLLCPRTFRSRVSSGLPVPGNTNEMNNFLERAPVLRLRAS